MICKNPKCGKETLTGHPHGVFGEVCFECYHAEVLAKEELSATEARKIKYGLASKRSTEKKSIRAEKIKTSILSENRRKPVGDGSIARAIGIPKSAVRNIRSELGIPSANGRGIGFDYSIVKKCKIK